MCRGLILVAVAMSGLGLGSEALAEVRAITDRNGNYSMTRVLTPQMAVSHQLAVADRMPGVWRPVGRGTGPQTLNPNGDRIGDLWPTISEPRVGPRFPWVVWSRLNGTHYDLVWSRWSRPGWTTTEWLVEGIAGDDLDPDVVFDAEGRPYVTWWADESGNGAVYFSFFLGTRWMPPLRVTKASVDARHPQLAIEQGGVVVIRYRTPNGRAEYTFQLNRPASITDDINPLGYQERGQVPRKR